MVLQEQPRVSPVNNTDCYEDPVVWQPYPRADSVRGATMRGAIGCSSKRQHYYLFDNQNININLLMKVFNGLAKCAMRRY